MSADTSPDTAPRLRSLDALRGFDMLWIVGLATLFREWAEVGDASWLDRWAAQLSHVTWEGLRAYDLIFPLFMFLSGVSIPYALGRGGNRATLLAKVARRAVLLVILGIIYNGGLQFEFANQRFASVLGQIGIAYAIAATVFLFTLSWRGRAIGCAGILMTVTVLQLWVPVPGHGAGNLSPDGIINSWIDRQWLPGRLHGGTFDPEGILCTLSAAAITLGGVLAGERIKSSGKPSLSTVVGFLVAGAILCGAGWLCWKAGYPPIKSAWTTSFNLLAGGICVALLAVFHLAVDFVPGFNWSFPLQIVGMNPLTIYLGARIVSFPQISAFFFGGVASLTGEWRAVTLAAGVLVIEWLVLWFLWRKRVFLRV